MISKIKIKSTLLSLLFLLPIVGCSSQPTAADYDDNYQSPYSLEWESPFGDTYHLGVAYLGKHDDLERLKASRIWLRTAYAYPLLRDLETIAADAGGNDFYLVISRDPAATITVTAGGKSVYSGGGDPILLRCNNGNAQITMHDTDGNHIEYTPLQTDDENEWFASLPEFVQALSVSPEEKFGTEFDLASGVDKIEDNIVWNVQGRIEEGRVIITVDESLARELCDGNGYQYILTDTRFEVQGLTRKCVGIKVSDIGQDTNPIVAMLMDDGTLEVLSIINSIFHNDWSSSGTRLKDIVSHTGYPSMEYASFGVVDSRCRDYEVPISHFGSWDEVVCGSHRLRLSQDWKIHYDNYRGHYEVLETSDDYSSFRIRYTMTAPDGKRVEGIFTFNRGEDYEIVPIEGPIDFGATGGKAVYKYKRFVEQTEE